MTDVSPPRFSAEWFAALRRVVNRAIDVAEKFAADPAVRDDFAALAGRALASNASPAAPTGEKAQPPTAVHEEKPAVPPIRAEPLPPLTGPRQVAADWKNGSTASWTNYPAPAEFDGRRVAARSRLKAEAARWQLERQRWFSEGMDAAEQDRVLLARARDSDIYLWMCNPAKWKERSEQGFILVAGCYDAMADAAELVAAAETSRQSQNQAIELLAEAQSAVRSAVDRYSTATRDDDERATFGWLREQTYSRRVMSPFMRLDSLAPPDSHEDIRRRVRLAREGLESVTERSRETEQLCRKVRYHASKLAERPAGDAEAEREIGPIAAAVEKLLESQIPPSDLRLREVLTPALDRMPDDVPPALARVLEAINAHWDEAAAADDEDDSPDADAPDPLVAAARERVVGRDAVLIGGRPSEPHRRRLEAGLGLHELNWVDLEHHESFAAAESAIRRPGVGLVMVMTRWRSHRDGPAARTLCKSIGAPLVEIPAGYNLRQVSHQIVRQIQPADVAERA